ncbi:MULTISPECIES: mannose-6-phosphate isomerase, class I [Vagococcus]|uniref:Mannose-6-phosphate isomerase n=1 Tax=Vagococcus fluvialis bH819 TaxID=1255619 RepID=A0A1X6WU88_9ENTE|nr:MULTISPECIES: mannose-6-phosphate isomerase, class I [Vagococcus]SLM87186.1 Mannose-6-phosphate isomerase [Vagococcus fluvialis bH819]HCM90080.1 mannose-6-phosphate isomerase, class I [Vagococcus sp.]
MLEPLFLQPVLQEKIWGGTKLKTDFEYPLESDKVGECWAISAHPHGVCTVENGPFKGEKLDELWKKQPELFGNSKEEVFPLLTKILDAADDLSVQVHPDDLYGKEHEGELGKTECWYIISADPGSEIIYGHHAKSKEELAEMIESGDWDHLLRKVPVKKGEFYFVPSGTIHAIGKGIMILETQQSSDTTYRVYDYDRLDDAGNPRELHIQQSLDVTNVPHIDPKLGIKEIGQGESSVITYIESDYFNVYNWEVSGILNLKASAPYTLVSVLDGFGYISLNDQKQKMEIKKGQHFILTSDIKKWHLEGDLQIIASEPGEKNR